MQRHRRHRTHEINSWVTSRTTGTVFSYSRCRTHVHCGPLNAHYHQALDQRIFCCWTRLVLAAWTELAEAATPSNRDTMTGRAETPPSATCLRPLLSIRPPSFPRPFSLTSPIHTGTALLLYSHHCTASQQSFTLIIATQAVTMITFMLKFLFPLLQVWWANTSWANRSNNWKRSEVRSSGISSPLSFLRLPPSWQYLLPSAALYRAVPSHLLQLQLLLLV